MSLGLLLFSNPALATVMGCALSYVTVWPLRSKVTLWPDRERGTIGRHVRLER